MKTSFPEGQQNIIDGKVLPYIQEHFSETLTVTEIADYAALNAQYMMRLFKKEPGFLCWNMLQTAAWKKQKNCFETQTGTMKSFQKNWDMQVPGIL